MKQRPPHLLPGQDYRQPGNLLFESPLDSWHEAVASGRGRLLSVEKLAAFAIVMAVLFSQVGLVTPPVDAAATFDVNSTADVVDLTPGDGACDTGNLVGSDPECTLRAAVQEANALAGADTINVPAGTYTLTLTGATEDAAATGDLDLLEDVAISGAGSGLTVIDGNASDRVFENRGTTTSGISSVTVTNGSASSDASAIYVNASTSMALDSVVVSGNSQTTAINNAGTLVITDSRITGNTSTSNGGGLITSGQLTVSGSLFDGNSTSVYGGAIYNAGGSGTRGLVNTTLSGNSANTGAAIYNAYQISLVNVTVTANNATLSGGGLVESTGGETTSLLNTIVAGNTAGLNPDVVGGTPYESQGNNIIGNSNISFGWVGSDQLDTDPSLAALADNGGPTSTHALLAGSAAIDNGSAAGAPATDQRGISRDASPDVGAYEYVAANAVAVNSTGDGTDNNLGDHTCDTGGTNSEGDPECTLRAAIQEANASANIDAIQFAIPTSDPGYSASPTAYTIAPATAYATLTDAVDVDATTQTGYAGTPVVVLDGSAVADHGLELDTGSDGSTIRGFAVHSFGSDGIAIGTDGNIIAGNWIGTDAAAGAGLGNTGAGVYVWNGAGNRIGGTAASDANAIVDNTDGVVLDSGADAGNAIIGNAIAANDDLGIDFLNDGVTANDSGDGDTGPNDLLNYPVITSATATGGTITAGFDLDAPDGSYRIEFFTNPSGTDPSGNGEGESLVGSVDVTVTGGSPSPASTTFPGSAGDAITATATSGTAVPFSSTSEFSAAFTAVAGPDGPGGVSANLELWLRADVGVTTSGQDVSSWADQSGSGNHAIQGTTGQQPDLLAAWLNSNPVVDFDGIDDFVAGSGGASSEGYYLVLIPDATIDNTTSAQAPFGLDCSACSANQGILGLGSVTSALTDEMVTHALGSGVEWRSGQTGATSYPGGEPMLLGVRTNASSNGTDIYSSGLEVDNATASSFVTVTDQPYAVARTNVATPFDALWFDGKVAEVISYSNRVSDAEHQRIQSYLAIKYGVTLDQSAAYDYVASDGTVIWDATANASYNNDIAGIGQDDASVLDQTQSSSVNSDAIVTVSNASSQQDGDFVVWGNDNGATTWTSTGSPVGERLQRTWRVDETGDIGTVTVEFDLTGLGAPGSVASDFHLLIDSDSDFTSGATDFVASGYAGGTATFTNVSALDGGYVTIAVASPPVANDDPGDLPTEVATRSPISYYRLGESSGPAVDEGSAGNDGIYRNAPTVGAAGALAGDADTAVDFDGSDDYVEVDHQAAYLLDNGTISFWFNADSLSTQMVPISKDSSGRDNGGHFGIYVQTDGSVWFRMQSKTADYSATSSTGIVSAGQWHHIAASFGDGGMELWIDGTLEATDPYTGGLGTTSGGSGNEEPLVIGVGTDGSGYLVAEPTSSQFDGRIDEVAIFGTQLGHDDIAALAGAADQYYTVAAGTLLSTTAADGVLANDSDANDDPLTAVLDSGPTNAASFTLNADGSFQYTSTAGFRGTDTFTYNANDGTANSNTATVTITVFDPSVAVVNSTGDAGDSNPGDDSCDTGATNAEGDPECTLRAAIAEANASAVVDEIEFDIPATDGGFVSGSPSYWVISPGGSEYGSIQVDNLDATTQPGWAGTPIIEVDGALFSGNEDGIFAGQAGMEVRGLSITGWPDSGAHTGSDNVTFAANWFGVDPAGTTAANATSDLVVWNGAANVTVGGNVAADGNVFAVAGSAYGIWLADSASGTDIANNRFGIGADGTSDLGPVGEAIRLWPADSTTIRDNVFGNLPNAAISQGSTSTGTVVTGNRFGLDDLDGAASVGEAVWLQSSGSLVFGGTGAGEGNTVRNATGNAIALSASATGDVTILGNSIAGSTDVGIDLGDDGVTANDSGDADTGPNDLLNFPVVTSAEETGGTVTVDFVLDVPAGDYRIEFFTNTAAHSSGNGEGEALAGSYDVAHPGGSASHSTSFAGSAGDILTATTTEAVASPFGPTSEFSAAFTVTVPDTTPPVITLVGDNPQTIEVGSAYTELGATALDDVDGDITGSIVIDSSAVNTSVVGSYSVTYDVTDSSGNAATQVVRTVDVVDTTAPVITLVGANPQVIEVGSAYSELGATASDNYDGDITGSIVVDASAVNTSVVGSYSVTYDVTDSEGNAATQVVRTVDVVDTTAPVITLVGANPQTIEVGGSYTELGATASDNYDGDITGSIVIDSTAVNTSVVGSYSVTYDVTDSSGNAATQVVRTVDVVDTTAPVITLVGADPQTIQAGSPYVELGATASDNYDGDISGSIVIDASAVNTSALGSYSVTYDVTDSSGNAATQVVRTVDVVDTTPPVITLSGANPQIIEVGSPYTELGATASDNLDGDITGSIVVDASAVNTSVVGSYSVTYDVTDSEGNAATQVVRTVDVVDTTPPVITLVGANPQIIEVGSPYTELGATASDNYDGDITGSIVIDASAVNTSIIGSYSVTYDVTDSEGNAATQVVRTVDVVDTTAPVITLVGADPQIIEVGSAYSELGATASDNYDGDITGSIVIDSSAVNTSVIGSYSVTYDVTDSEGNAATQVTRTVDVVDTTAPLITLVGANPQTIEVGSAYSELGATASDNYDGDITGSIVIDSTAVNTSVVGSYSATYNVTDSSGNAATQIVRTVDVVDTTAPVITLVGADPQTIDFGSPYTELGATASDNYDGDITGSIVVDASAVNTSALGSYSVTYDVTDSEGNAATQVTRTVDVVNAAPTLGAIADQFGDEGSAIAFTATASDPDPTDTFVFSLNGEPSGAVISPAGDFLWTPTEAQGPGSYGFDVVVTDGGTPGRTDSQTVTITVAEVNQAPVLDPAGPFAVDELATLTFDASVTDLDVPANPVSYSLAGAPAGATIDAATGRFTWTPAEGQGPGSYAFDVRVDDNGAPNLGDSITVTVDVGEVNAAPNVTNPGDQASAEGESVALAIVASDPDSPADSLSFAATGLPDGLTIDPASGMISGNIAANAAGGSPFAATVTVTDSGIPNLSASVAFSWSVAVANTAPLVTHPGTQQSAEGEAVSLQVVAVDPDTPPDTLVFAATRLPDGLSIDAATGVISGVPSFDAASGSPYQVTVTVGDTGTPPLSSLVNFDWVITNTNRAPTALDITVYADAGVPAPLVLSGSDPDGDPITFTVVTSPTRGSLVGGSRAYDYTANATASGFDSFTFAVSDGVAEVIGTVTIEISPNLPPVGELDEYTVRQGGTLVVDAPGVLANDGDPEGEPITAAVEEHPSFGTLTLAADGSVAYTHTGDDLEPDSFTYRISDGVRLSAPILVEIQVVENIAPTAVHDVVSLDEDSVVVFFPLDNDFDGNGEDVHVTDVLPPEHGILHWTTDGRFFYRPHLNWNGAETFSYLISDGDLVSVGTVQLTVLPVNDPPHATPAEAVGHSGDSIVVDLRSAAFDVDNDPLTFVLRSPETAQITEIEPGVFEVSLQGVVRDMPPLVFVVVDPAGLTASSSLTIAVRIPADLIDVPALIRGDLDGSDGMFETGVPQDPPSSSLAPAGLRLMVGSVLETFTALRLPVLAVVLLALASLYVGVSRRFAFSSTPTALPMTARTRVAIVMAPSSAGVPARSEPGIHQSVQHRFGPDETAIVTTGSRALLRGEVWVEVETPHGDAWISSACLSEQVSDAEFDRDERPLELVADLVEQIYSSGDLQQASGGHDLHVAFYGPPVRFAASSLSSLLRGASVYWWWQPEGDTPRLQGTFSEVVGESITAAYRNQGARPGSARFPIPREFVNLHSLVIGTDDYGDGWRIFFRYENGEPAIAALMREAAPNPSAVHGRLDMQVS